MKKTSWKPESAEVWRNANGFLRTRSGTAVFITKAWMENYPTSCKELSLTVGFLKIISSIIGKVTWLYFRFGIRDIQGSSSLSRPISGSFSFLFYDQNNNNNNGNDNDDDDNGIRLWWWMANTDCILKLSLFKLTSRLNIFRQLLFPLFKCLSLLKLYFKHSIPFYCSQ